MFSSLTAVHELTGYLTQRLFQNLLNLIHAYKRVCRFFDEKGWHGYCKFDLLQEISVMAAEQDLKLDGAGQDEASSGGGKKKFILIIVAVVLLIGLAVGTTVFLMISGDGEAEVEALEDAVVEEVITEEPESPAQYVVLKPEFVVSFQVGTRQRFLQASIEVMTRQQAIVDALTLHEPMIRNDIIRIMGEQDFKQLRTAEGRVAMQNQLLKHLKDIMKREADTDGVEAVLFTNLVMQ
jgi:flagellar FliL protein